MRERPKTNEVFLEKIRDRVSPYVSIAFHEALECEGVLKRNEQFALGRKCAAEVLKSIGVSGEITRTSNGIPIWPQESVGSITHSSRYALAAAARKEHLCGVGVDLELRQNQERANGVRSKFLNSWELSLLKDDSQLIWIAFSAKESLIKAFSCLTLTQYFFNDFLIKEMEGGSFTFEVTRVFPHFSSRGTYLCDPRFVVTMVELMKST